jgi:hypothetical protein
VLPQQQQQPTTGVLSQACSDGWVQLPQQPQQQQQQQ